MATWQFTLDLIPASTARVSGVDAIRLTQEQLDECRLHLASSEETALFDALGKLMPERTGWTDRIRFWGDEKGDDAHVSFDGDAVEYLQFRLDVSKLSLPLLGGICALATRFGCVFATREGAVIQPTCEAVLRAVLQSSAMRFVKDPEAFLAEAARLDRQLD